MARCFPSAAMAKANAGLCRQAMVDELLAAGHVPDTHGSIHSAGDQRLPIRDKTDNLGKIFVPFEAAVFRARFRVPNPNRLVFACGSQQSAIRAKCHRHDAPVVAFQDE